VYAAALGWTDLSTRQRHGFENSFKAKGGLVIRLLDFSPVFLIGHVPSSVSHKHSGLLRKTMGSGSLTGLPRIFRRVEISPTMVLSQIGNKFSCMLASPHFGINASFARESS